MNKGTIVLVGCVLGAGALFHQGQGAGARSGPTATPTAESHSTPELARSGKTPKPSPVATDTATPVAFPTQQRLTIDQIRALPRPGLPFIPAGPVGAHPSNRLPPTAATELPAETPSATPSPTAPLPPSEAPPASTPTPWAPPPTATPTRDPFPIPTPPPLPPYPDAGLAPLPPTE